MLVLHDLVLASGVWHAASGRVAPGCGSAVSARLVTSCMAATTIFCGSFLLPRKLRLLIFEKIHPSCFVIQSGFTYSLGLSMLSGLNRVPWSSCCLPDLSSSSPCLVPSHPPTPRSYKALSEFSKEDARSQFLRILRTLPYGSSTFFTVKRIEDPIGLLPAKLVLGINKRGVHFFR